MDLAVQLTPRVEVTLGGRSWRLVFTHRVLLECEELTGMSLLTGANLSSARLIRALLYFALRREGSSYTPDEIGRLLRPRPLGRIQEAVYLAWEAAMPELEADLGPDTGRRKAPPLTWLNAWAMARFDLHLSSDEWLDMTPRQLHALKQRQLERWQREELLVGIVASTTANFSMNHPRSPVLAESFMLHPFKREPQTIEDVMHVFSMLRHNQDARERQLHAA